LLDQQFYQNEKFQEFLNSNFILFRAARGDKSGDQIFEKFNIRATPTTMVIDNDGSEIDWHVGYGPPPDKFLARLEKTVKGIDTFKSLSENYSKDPKNAEAVFKLARKWDDKYDQEKAAKLYKEVLTLDPDGKMGMTDYGDEKVTYTEYAEYSIGALSLFGRPMDIEPMKTFIKKYPESKMLRSAYMRLSSYYRSRGSKEEATQFFEDYTAKYPEDPYVLSSYISRIIRTKDNIDKGIELAEKIKDVMKYNPDPRYIKDFAELHMLNEDEKKADEVFGKRFMEGKVSGLALDLVDYANFWVKHNTNIESAEEMMELAIRLAPDRWYTYRYAAEMYLKLKKDEKALEKFGPEFIKKNDDEANVLSSYARFWANQGKNLESAVKASKKSVALAPSSYSWDTLSLVYTKLKKYDEALKAAEKAVGLSDERSKIRYQNRIKQIKKAMEKEKK
jgi:tetratricopeptide (TPR) repeat protein